jgi:hypothetical protein
MRQTLQAKGFSNTWCQWIETFTRNKHVGIKINDQVGEIFHTKKGLRQGDPLSPILFNIVPDMLVIIINRAKNNGQIARVVPHLVNNGLSIPQYVDDTLICMDVNLEKSKNLKLLLCAENSENVYSHLFRCQLGAYPFKYLGILMHYKRMNNKD